MRQGLFFAHLSVEKILRAHYCKLYNDIPPRIHNLVRLVNLLDITVQNETLELLSEINSFHRRKIPKFSFTRLLRAAGN
ncbi:HEPN domain-containing protein [Sedimentisphaera cyanobacteriorum]|uniref:HEPN domain-containing protein n=1 Tax=Sedimentisphaera cyanobacteriorum TaxID=1940790 RepID=UPI0009860DD1